MSTAVGPRTASEFALEAQAYRARFGQGTARAIVEIDEELRRLLDVEDVVDDQECAEVLALPAEPGVHQGAARDVAEILFCRALEERAPIVGVDVGEQARGVPVGGAA